MSAARAGALQPVTSSPSTSMRPAARPTLPVIALSRVDLPAPLLPITVTNWPAGRSRSTPHSARVSSTVPGANTTCRSRRRITRPSAGPGELLSGLRAPGRIKARPTSTAVTRFRSEAVSPSTSEFSASATASRYRMEPARQASTTRPMWREGRIVSPTITAARPTTIVPVPMLMSAKPAVWANSAPASATSALLSAMPARMVGPVRTPWACAMRGLAPVARMARP